MSRATSGRPYRVLLLAGILGGPAAADTILLQSGATEDGFVAGKGPRGEVLVGTAKGIRRIVASAVTGVKPGADPAADFERYFPGVPRRDADTMAALGAWAREREIPEAAERAFRLALEWNPEQAVARAGLGFEKVDGAWLTPEQVRRRHAEEKERTALADREEKAVGKRPEVVFTDHWRYANLLDDRKAADRAKDLETAWTEAVAILGSDPWQGRALAVACDGKERYLKWIGTEGATLPGMRGPFLEAVKATTGLKWTAPPTLARFDVPGTAAMHAAFVHSAGHLLVNNWKGYNRSQPFWIEEGFGGWMEDRVLQSRSSFCWGAKVKTGYGVAPRNIQAWESDDPDWRTLVKQAAEKNEFLPLDQMDGLMPGEYSRREVGQAFSFVAFLLSREPARFRDYLTRVKAGTRSPDSFKQAYGKSFEEIEPEWKQFAISGW